MEQKGAQTEAERTEMADKDYLGVLGCLAYIANKSRPDVRFHVSHQGQFSADPCITNYNACITILIYLMATSSYGIEAGGAVEMPKVPTECKPAIDEESFLANHGFYAASDATGPGAKAQAGWVLMYLNAAICWVSRKVKVITTGTTEAETVAGVGAAKDIKFALSIFSFIRKTIKGPVPLLIDNSGMWFNVRNEVASSGNRHWDTWQHFVRECYLRFILSVHKVHTDEEFADLLTKALAREDGKFERFSRIMMNA